MAYIGVGKVKPLQANALQACVIRGRGPSVGAALKRFGWGSEAACITAVVSLEKGRILGTRYEVRGTLGTVNLSLAKLQLGGTTRKVKLDLTDLSVFEFSGETSPTEASNLSNWIEGVTLVSEYTEGDRTITDRGLIKNEQYFKDEGFSLR
jgi:hypothetical protein